MPRQKEGICQMQMRRSKGDLCVNTNSFFLEELNNVDMGLKFCPQMMKCMHTKDFQNVYGRRPVLWCSALSCCMPHWHPMALVTARIPVTLFLTQLSASVPGEVAADGPSAWTLGAHLRDQNRAPCSWLWPGQDLAIVAFGE